MILVSQLRQHEGAVNLYPVLNSFPNVFPALAQDVFLQLGKTFAYYWNS
jgi:hypothetical protein